MRNSVKEELKAYVISMVDDNVLTMENKDDWHYLAFNEDYYLIGYYNCDNWLKDHNIGQFEAANICVQYEIDQYGQSYKEYDNSETVVNMLAYIFGEEVIYEMEDEIIDLIELVEF